MSACFFIQYVKCFVAADCGMICGCVVWQMAVAVYFLDKLALRAGHEKDDDEADTVGCCTLKVGWEPQSGLVMARKQWRSC